MWELLSHSLRTHNSHSIQSNPRDPEVSCSLRFLFYTVMVSFQSSTKEFFFAEKRRMKMIFRPNRTVINASNERPILDENNLKGNVAQFFSSSNRISKLRYFFTQARGDLTKIYQQAWPQDNSTALTISVVALWARPFFKFLGLFLTSSIWIV